MRRLHGIDRFLAGRLCSVAGDGAGVNSDAALAYPLPGTSTAPPDPAGEKITPEVNHAAANHHVAAANHVDSGLEGFTSMFEGLMAQYDALLQAYLNPEPEEEQQGPDPGSGFEGTVLNRSVLDEDEINAPSLFPMDAGIQRQVMDPVTGAIYASPAAALSAGVLSWQYVPVPAGGMTTQPPPPVPAVTPEVIPPGRRISRPSRGIGRGI